MEFPRNCTKNDECFLEGGLSDEDRYAHSWGYTTYYEEFEQAREEYILFALQLIRFYNELKMASIELDYIYGIAFRLGYSPTDVQSNTFHLGLFYEIVLTDREILVSYQN